MDCNLRLGFCPDWFGARCFAAFAIFAVLGLTSTVTNVTYLGVPVEANRYLALAWIAFIVLVGYLVVLGMSVPKLKAMQKSGWNLTFYSTLFFAGYDVFNWLQYPSVGLFSLIWNLLGVAVSLYVLFQIRSYFTK